MSDHADTIRAAIAHSRYRIIPTWSHPAACEGCKAEAAVDALRAERQQAIDERDALRAQQAPLIDKWIRTANGLEARAIKAEARCEQAIDALREIAQLAQRFHPIAGYQYDASPANIARAALVNLGEAPE